MWRKGAEVCVVVGLPSTVCNNLSGGQHKWCFRIRSFYLYPRNQKIKESHQFQKSWHLRYSDFWNIKIVIARKSKCFKNGFNPIEIDHFMRSFNLKYYHGIEHTYSKYYGTRAYFAQNLKCYSHSTTLRTPAPLKDWEWQSSDQAIDDTLFSSKTL